MQRKIHKVEEKIGLSNSNGFQSTSHRLPRLKTDNIFFFPVISSEYFSLNSEPGEVQILQRTYGGLSSHGMDPSDETDDDGLNGIRDLFLGVEKVMTTNVECGFTKPHPEVEFDLISRTDALTVKRVYALGRVISEVFEEQQLHYWTSGGTTLGIVRHKGLIPWDDDLDICILDRNVPFFLEAAEILSDIYNIKVEWTSFVGYRMYHKSDSQPLHSYRYPFCDVFVMEEVENGECVISSPRGRTLWPKEKYKLEDIRDPEFRLFGDFYLRCPKNAENYLDRYYGPDWAVTAFTQDYCHLTTLWKTPKKSEILSYEPAKPFI